MNKFVKTDTYNIFIGLKDQDSYKELDIVKFKEILSDICHNKKIGFSMVKQIGGYTHNKGYVTETSLKITLVGSSFEEVEKIGLELKKIINTDTIMITKEQQEVLFA